MRPSDYVSYYDILPDAVLIQSGGRLIYVNPAAAALLGYPSPRELVGTPVLDIVHPDQRDDVTRRIEEASAGRPTPLMRQRLIRADGSHVTVEVSGRPLTTAGGEPTAVALVRDLTDRLGEEERLRAVSERAAATEEALRASERRFRHLIEYGSELIFVVDPEGTLKYVSGTSWSLLGYDPAELVGKSAFTFAHPDDSPIHIEMLRDVARAPRRRRAVTARIRSSDDRYRTFAITAVNLLDDPTVEGIVLNAHDVTEQNRLSETVEQLRRIESLGRVAAAVVHEFNNVLAAADAFTTLLERNPAELTTAVGGLRKSIERGRSITSDILEYATTRELIRAPIRAREWLDELREELEPLIDERNPLHLRLAEHAPVIYGDRHRLSQALMNLVMNARDASAPGQPITIAVGPSIPADGSVTIEVRDEGAGIPAEIVDKVFEPLLTTKSRGTGLGLAIVHQIVVRHRGTITVASEPGKGTTFRIVLPAAQREG